MGTGIKLKRNVRGGKAGGEWPPMN